MALPYKFLLAVSAFVLCMLGACVTTKFQAPELSIVNIGMVSADVFSQQFRIHLHVQNPNDRELPIQSIEYELFMQGDSFAEGGSELPFMVPAHGAAEFDMLMTTNFVSNVARLLAGLNGSDGNKVQYDFIGKVHLSKGFVRTLPFAERGMVELGIKK